MIIAKGSSWDGASDGTDDVYADVCPNPNNVTVIAVTGSTSTAITQKTGQVLLTGGTAATALTLEAPISGTDDYKKLSISATHAVAHVITNASVGFNAKGSSGTITFPTTSVNPGSVVLLAYLGNWYVVENTGCTVA